MGKSIKADIYAAKKYINKIKHASDSGIEFSLSLFEFKRIVSKKLCFYTGVIMSKPIGESSAKDSDLTLDRIDNSKGYVSGNVVACTKAANNIKAIWENPKFSITVENARDVAQKTIDILNKINKIDKS